MHYFQLSSLQQKKEELCNQFNETVALYDKTSNPYRKRFYTKRLIEIGDQLNIIEKYISKHIG
jgi:uncharacterized membrane-anchored protein YhcB (DUF1043 family)